jgi:hypothetical protein
LLFKLGGTRIGFCEVKKPSTDRLNSFTPDLIDLNTNLQIQITNYLVQVKYVHGIESPIGIVTTYNEWRICFLRESYQLMAKRIESFDSSVASSTQSTGIGIPPEAPEHTQLFISRVYNFNEPQLFEVLAATISKMVASARSAPLSFLRSLTGEPRKFADETIFELKAVPGSLKSHHLTYMMPTIQTIQYYFIQDFHGGRDGRVWLAMSESGKLAVVKLSLERSYDQEANNWRVIWGVSDVRTAQFFGANAMIMPVVFHGGEDGEGLFYSRFCCPVGPKWSVGKCTEDYIRSSEVTCNFDGSLTKYFNDPNLAAKEAIVAMVAQGYEHLDLCWRHVALLTRS